MAGLENWDQLTPRQRAVFFCCDGLKSNAKLASQKTQAIGICGQDIFDRYYLDNGNEARIKAAYDKRDPRLKQTIVTPYEPVDCFTAGLNGNENMIGKQLRWPLYLQGTSGGDFWLDKRTSAYYCYRKYVRFLKGELIDRQRCYTDFPLIRYTDVILQWAEALIELNEFTPAKNLIDQVRARAHIPGITIGDLDAMREAVRYERRVEFPVEAVNFFDEVRWGTYKETKSPGLRRGGVHTPEPADNPEGRQPETKPFHIMVVEDTPDLREFLVKNFEDTYGVLSAKNGAEALAILEKQACDLIISDALMPEMDGFDLLMKVRNDEMLCHIPFILLSVVDSVDSKIKGLEYGADVYIEKPFSLGYVKATVESLLENRKRAFRHFASRPGFQYEKDDMGRNDGHRPREPHLRDALRGPAHRENGLEPFQPATEAERADGRLAQRIHPVGTAENGRAAAPQRRIPDQRGLLPDRIQQHVVVRQMFHEAVRHAPEGFHPAESGREIIRIRVRERCSSKKCSRSCRYLRRARFSGFGHAPLRRGLEALLALPVGQFGMRGTDRVVADDVSAQALGFGKQ